MKSLKISLIALFLFFPFIGHADSWSSCQFSSASLYDLSSPSSSDEDFEWVYLDCLNSDYSPAFIPTLSFQRDVLTLADNRYILGDYNYILDTELNEIAPLSSFSGEYYLKVDQNNLGLDDGQYYLTFGRSGVTPEDLFPFWVYEERIYLNFSEIPLDITSDETVQSYLGSLNFGLAILIVISLVYFIIMLWNNIKPKKKW